MQRATLSVVFLIALIPMSEPRAQFGNPSTRPAEPESYSQQLMQLRSFYARTDPTVRRKLQENLVWIGQYAGPIDGEIGEATIKAIRNFQKEIRQEETGLLLQHQFVELTQRAAVQIKNAGFVVFTDHSTGIKIGLPSALLPERRIVEGGADYSAPDRSIVVAMRSVKTDISLRQLFERIRSEVGQSSIQYEVLRSDWFVVSGIRANKRFYVRYHSRPGLVSGFSLIYEDEVALRYPASFFSMISFSLQPFDAASGSSGGGQAASIATLSISSMLSAAITSETSKSLASSDRQDSRRSEVVTSIERQGSDKASIDSSKSKSDDSGFNILIILVGGLVVIVIYRKWRRWKYLVGKYGDEDALRIWNKEIWQGMTSEQLIDAWGKPVDIDTNLYKTKTTETWKYNQTGKNRFRNRVIVENEIIVGWKTK